MALETDSVSNSLFIRKANPLNPGRMKGTCGKDRDPPWIQGQEAEQSLQKTDIPGQCLFFISWSGETRHTLFLPVFSALLWTSRLALQTTSKYRHAWRHWGLKLQHMTWGEHRSVHNIPLPTGNPSDLLNLMYLFKKMGQYCLIGFIWKLNEGTDMDHKWQLFSLLSSPKWAGRAPVQSCPCFPPDKLCSCPLFYLG